MMSQRQAGHEDPMLSFFMNQRKILEINPEHQTIKLMLQAVSKDADNPDLPGIARALYDSAMITSGFTLQNPRRFANSVEKLAFRLLGEKYVDEPVEEEAVNPADLDIQNLLNMAREHEESMTEQASEMPLNETATDKNQEESALNEPQGTKDEL